jgi:hypothetical protein
MMRQHEAVIQVMRDRGGYATLGLLYQETLKIPDVTWNTKTPFKSINRIVQTRDEFFKLRPGLWALKEYRDRIPQEFSAESASSNPQAIEFEHSYYQVLLVQIGNAQRQGTFVPAHDRQRHFQKTSLDEIITVKEIYPFSYPPLVKRASTIDVIWFNERNMPGKVYEVEHSTDIQNSLLKFGDLQDFNNSFFIVADNKRKKEFDKKIGYQAFHSIHSRVKFLSYEQVSEWHAKAIALSIVENTIGL